MKARFHQFGLLGTALGFSLWVLLAWARQLPLWVTVAMLLTFVAELLSLAMITKIAIGRERLVYYHHEIAALAATGVMLKLIGAPVLPYLEIAALGLGVFLGCGRLGCWTTGCCYGRPHRWGVRFAAMGQPPYGAGVRLVPVPLMESAWVFATVAIGVAIVPSSPPGNALGWYSVAYGIGRFGFEFLRGDPDRPYWKGVSEAQWTSWLLVTLTAIAEVAGILPFHLWHAAAAAALTAAVATLALSENVDRALLRPAHLCQVVEVLETARALAESTGELCVGRTSLGLQISATPVEDGDRRLEVVAFSRAGDALPRGTAARLASAIAQLRGAGTPDLSAGTHAYHLVLPARSTHAI
jgi:prolipoprotein diacylglyceryltransferase